MSDTKQVALRIEPSFHEQISILAKKEHRSIHSQVLFMLQCYFDAGALRKRIEELERHAH